MVCAGRSPPDSRPRSFPGFRCPGKRAGGESAHLAQHAGGPQPPADHGGAAPEPRGEAFVGPVPAVGGEEAGARDEQTPGEPVGSFLLVLVEGTRNSTPTRPGVGGGAMFPADDRRGLEARFRPFRMMVDNGER